MYMWTPETYGPSPRRQKTKRIKPRHYGRLTLDGRQSEHNHKQFMMLNVGGQWEEVG